MGQSPTVLDKSRFANLLCHKLYHSGFKKTLLYVKAPRRLLGAPRLSIPDVGRINALCIQPYSILSAITARYSKHSLFLISSFLYKKSRKPLKKRLSALLSGAPKGIRTPGLPLRRGTLYPAELLARISNEIVNSED